MKTTNETNQEMTTPTSSTPPPPPAQTYLRPLTERERLILAALFDFEQRPWLAPAALLNELTAHLGNELLTNPDPELAALVLELADPARYGTQTIARRGLPEFCRLLPELIGDPAEAMDQAAG